MTHISLLRTAGTGLLLALSQLATAESDLQANPYRPSVGSPATLPVPGYLEVEFGVANANTSGSNTKNSPLLLKYAFNERIGLTLGLNPLTQVKTDSSRTTGLGDGNLTLKLTQPIAEGFNIGEEFSTTLPIATHDLGTNRANQTVNFIVSNDFSGFHSDINLNTTHYGDRQDEGVSQNALGWSAGLSHPITGKLSGGIELSGTKQRGTDSTVQVLESVGYSLSNKTVLDFYLAQQKINSDTNNYSFGFGITHLFAK
ncbi:hypothetical protein [Aquirhabdus sp.]|uniref:hypothetical protein n=1 Tax=Aquirhabdus sp. TaxID=2824160 RepID=UPI00396CD41A